MRTYDSPRDLLGSSLAPEAPLSEVVRWAVAHASLAPSELNTQPWRFRADIDPQAQSATIELLLDESRLLPTIDPTGREAVLACGAALLNLRLALRGAAMGTGVRLCPDPHRPELLASVEVAGSTREPLEERSLRLAIPLRGTHRGGFEPASVPQDLVDRLVAEAAYEGACIAVVDVQERSQVAPLNEEAERRLWLNPAFRREVAAWSRSNRSDRPDGVPGFARGLKTWQSWLEPARMRSGRPSLPGEPDDRDAVDEAPLLLVVGAASEKREALVRAGAGMQRLLLSASSAGLAASYLNAALHEPELRQSLGRAVQLDHPQVVLRIGYAELDPATARRPEAAVLDLREAARP